jgi:hypothetical protein
MRGRWLEAVLFLSLAFAVPMDPKVTNVLAPTNALAVQRLLLAMGLAVVFTAVAAMNRRGIAMAAAVLPFVVVPTLGQVRRAAAAPDREMAELVRWARESTPKEAVFQFDGAGRGLEPGIFRASAVRSVYADWKGGGQVNFLREFARVWWERWQKVQKPLPLERYAGLGIDFVVYRADRAPRAAKPVYSNEKYAVFAVGAPSGYVRTLSTGER